MFSGFASFSHYRRHKMAGPVLIVTALITVGSAFTIASALPSAQQVQAGSRSTLIKEGKQIFLKGCSSCH